MGEDLSWTNLCARAQANLDTSLLGSIVRAGLDTSLLGSIVRAGLEARDKRNIAAEMQALQPLLKAALDRVELEEAKPRFVYRKYPSDVVNLSKRHFILYLNRKLPAPFCAWDASTDKTFRYAVGWSVPIDKPA